MVIDKPTRHPSIPSTTLSTPAHSSLQPPTARRSKKSITPPPQSKNKHSDPKANTGQKQNSQEKNAMPTAQTPDAKLPTISTFATVEAEAEVKKKAIYVPPKPILKVKQQISVATDWRTVALGEPHKGSFIWEDEEDAAEPTKRNCCKKCKCCEKCNFWNKINCWKKCNCCKFCQCCVNRCIRCEGRTAVLKGEKMKIPRKISVIEFFRHQIDKLVIRADYPAVLYGPDDEDSLTYRDLDLISNALANMLRKRLEERKTTNMNLDGDIVIAFCAHANVRYILLLFATLKLGATCFPISMEFPAEKIYKSILAVRPVITIVAKDTEIVDKMSDPRFKDYDVVYLEDLWDLLENSDAPLDTRAVQFIKSLPRPPQSNTVALKKPPSKFRMALGRNKPDSPLHDRCVAIISPSNSSGYFTGVRYKSHSIFNWITWEWTHFTMLPGENVMLQSDYDTVASLAEIFSPLLRGCCLVLVDSEDVKNPVILLDRVKEFQIVRLSIWPSILHAILRVLELIGVEDGKRFLETVKFWFCIGGSMNSELGDLFFSLLPPSLGSHSGHRFLINMYGNDEDMGAVSYQIVDSTEHIKRLNYHSKMPIGSPLPNVRIYLVDAQMNLVRGDKLGMICVAGEMLADNYTTAAGHPEDKIIINPFSKKPALKLLLKTGDYGRIITGDFGQRYLIQEDSRYLDRHANIDSRVVELDEIELHLRNSGLMTDCYVLCYRSGHEDQTIIGFCCCKESVFPKVLEYLTIHIPAFMVPDLVEISEIPHRDDGSVIENYLLRYHYDVMIKRKEFDDWSTLGEMPPEKLHAVKVLFTIIFQMVGVPLKDLAKMYRSHRFGDIPRASYSKSIFIVYEIHKSSYPLSLGEFMNAKSLEEIANNMLSSRKTRGQYFIDDSAVTSDWRFRVETMTDSHKAEVLELLAKTLTSKGSLDYYAETKRQDIKKFVSSMWKFFSDKRFSKILKRYSDGKIIGVIISVNYHDEVAPKSVKMSLEVSYRFQLMNLLEDGFSAKSNPTGIQIVYATIDDIHLNHLETYSLMERLIGETVKMAEALEFDVVVFTTYEYFVTDICVSNFGFNVIRECQLNQFVAANGHRPFFVAPDALVATLCVRRADFGAPLLLLPVPPPLAPPVTTAKQKLPNRHS